MILELSDPQMEARELLNDPQVVDLYYGGAAGGGKSLLLCIWMLEEFKKFPGIRIGLGRKELTRLKQTTVVTLLREAHRIMNVKKGSFDYMEQKGLIRYRNGCEIQLIDLNRQPSDPDFDTLGSLNLTHVAMEEAGEISKKAKDVFSSRKNRFMNQEYGIVGKTILTGNPSQNFTRDEYYEPYKKLGMGHYQKWQHGQVEIKGKMHPAYRAFVKSLATDNPFISHNYIEVLRNLPPQEKKRLFEGNWDYLDTDDMLFPSLLIDRALISELSVEEDSKRYIGVDVADKGKDKTIVTLIENGIITDQRRLEVDTTGEKAISEMYALELIRYAQQHGFDNATARNIAIESNGVGVGMRDFMRAKGWFISEYTATSQSRGQSYYNAAKHLDDGKLKIFSQLPTLTELRKQMMAVTYKFKENLEPDVLKKDKIKEVLGYSPDELDSAVIANWVANKPPRKVRVLF